MKQAAEISSSQAEEDDSRSSGVFNGFVLLNSRE